jgi:hypothetical protein
MLRSIAAVLAVLCLAPAVAQEAGRRILTTPQIPQPKDASGATTRKTGICDRLEGDERKRCQQRQRVPQLDRPPTNIGIDSGPGSTGMGSGAGGGASGSGGGAPH